MKPSNRLDIEDHEFFFLLRVAHLALDHGLVDAADGLMKRLQPVRPENPHPRIGQALVQYVLGQRVEAIEGLQGVLRDFPDAVFTRSLLAKFLKESDQSGWEILAQETLERVQDGVSAEIAREVLGIPEPNPLHQTAVSSGPDDRIRALDIFQGRRA